jgi:hypothetical protein
MAAAITVITPLRQTLNRRPRTRTTTEAITAEATNDPLTPS